MTEAPALHEPGLIVEGRVSVQPAGTEVAVNDTCEAKLLMGVTVTVAGEVEPDAMDTGEGLEVTVKLGPLGDVTHT